MSILFNLKLFIFGKSVKNLNKLNQQKITDLTMGDNDIKKLIFIVGVDELIKHAKACEFNPIPNVYSIELDGAINMAIYLILERLKVRQNDYSDTSILKAAIALNGAYGEWKATRMLLNLTPITNGALKND